MIQAFNQLAMDIQKIKPLVINQCKDVLKEKIELLSKEIQLLIEDISEDTKSSAGDKFETSREMANIERQKLSGQLELNKKSLGILANLSESVAKEIQLGTIVETSSAIIYIAVSLGIMKVAGQNILAISPNAPLAQVLLGKVVGDEVEFNSRTYKILGMA